MLLKIDELRDLFYVKLSRNSDMTWNFQVIFKTKYYSHEDSGTPDFAVREDVEGDVKYSIRLRSSHSQMFSKIDVLKNILNTLAILTQKHLCWRPATLLERDRCFPVNIAKFLGTPFL